MKVGRFTVSILSIVTGGLMVCAGLLAGASTLAAMQWLENKEFPVLVDWKPAQVEVIGANVVVAGTQRKVRDCQYIPPIRAEASNGKHLIVKSYSPSSTQNWRAGDQPRQFGPWEIQGAAGQRTLLYAEHRCHDFWPVFSVLGVVDAR